MEKKNILLEQKYRLFKEDSLVGQHSFPFEIQLYERFPCAYEFQDSYNISNSCSSEVKLIFHLVGKYKDFRDEKNLNLLKKDNWDRAISRDVLNKLYFCCFSRGQTKVI